MNQNPIDKYVEDLGKSILVVVGAGIVFYLTFRAGIAALAWIFS